MRYKVKVADAASFARVKRAAERCTTVHVVSEGRRTLSIGDLSEDEKEHLTQLGARVAPEMQYDPERSAA
jgi:hypothetical protein